MPDKDEMLREIMDKCYSQIKPEPEDTLNLEDLSQHLEEKLGIGCNIKIEESPDDPYVLKVSLNLPPFVPCLDEAGELWYVCTRKDIDLRYTIKDDQYIFQSNDLELLELVLDGLEVN